MIIKDQEAFKDVVAMLLVFGGLVVLLFYVIYIFISGNNFNDFVFIAILSISFLSGGLYGLWQKRVLAVGGTRAQLVYGREAIFFSIIYILFGIFILYLLLK